MKIENKGIAFTFTLIAWDGAPATFNTVAKDEKEAKENLVATFKGFIDQINKSNFNVGL